ncbi:HesA/MoeB/ThiF family protein [Palleronia caenipelagi]|uniref:Molybdopterin-synthase adenylyltransferase n=1 Tax=Palleronia caenipelagi TaxID=2489174 RepID=A0A547Q7E2_9RHOB|nr:HesA/MoeB/ThiF family protein [Palleronia caenipelagi]TRD22307.1 HesA/MoeB/ThiF family protein [Palleronia caenipelagi]
MLLALVLAAVIWFGSGRLGWPKQARLIALGLLYLGVLALLLILPPGAPLRAALGGEASEWLILGGLIAVVLAYRQGLRWVRTRVRPENRPQERDSGTFGPGEIDRYARHVMLREIGGAGQARLKSAKVLVIGAGGLGAPALLYLAAAGVGRIGVIDDDVVEASNLQRQVIHTSDRVGMPKVFSAQKAMEAINPFLEVRPYHRRLTAEIAEDLVAEYDLVLDGCDDFETRRVLNAACHAARVPLISGALSQWEGQLTTYAPWGGTPCHVCVFPEKPAAGLAPTCAEAGVLGPLPGIVGAMMAAEAVKEITGAGQGLRGRMAFHDALWGEHREIRLSKRADCPVCGNGP